MILGGGFYDDVLRQLVTAIGAALFVANALALLRRASPPPSRRGEAPRTGEERQLTRAPIARTVTFMLVGLVVMVWGFASLMG